MFSLLYVDDEPALLEICRLFLEQDGEFTVATAQSGSQALELLKKGRFDAIVSDFQMPEMDGIGLLKNVRSTYGRIPFILFTGRGREEIVIAAINNGADFYIQKGGDPKAQFAELAHKLRQAIGRIQAEKALRESEKRLTDIINFLPDATFAIDTAGTVIAWNRAMERMTGVSVAGIMGKGDHEYAITFYGNPRPMLIDLIFAPDNEFEQAHYNYTRHTPTNLTAETVIEKEGKPRVCLWGTASALFDENGTLAGAIESVRDITEMKTAGIELRAANEQLVAAGEELKVQYDELALRGRQVEESEEKYRTLVENSQDVIYRTDREGRLIMVSPSGPALLGYDSAQDLLGKFIEDDLYFTLGKRREFLETIRRSVSVKGLEVTLRHKDGSPVTVSTSSHLYYDRDGSMLGVEGVFHDITGLKVKENELRSAYEQIAAAEEELRSQYEELKKNGEALQKERNFSDAVLDSVPGLLYLYDGEGRLVRWNRNHETATGYSHEELAGMHLMDWYRGNEKASALIRGRVKKAMEEGYADAEAEMTVKDGSKIWYYFTAVRLEIAGKKYFTGIGIDISARKQAEQKTRESRRQLDEIAATIPGLVYRFYARQDGSRGISYYGGRAQEIFGAPADVPDFLAWHMAHVHPDDRQQLLDSIDAALAKNGPWHFEGRFVKPSGETIWFEGRANPVRHDDEQVYSGVLLDITQRKLAEQALCKSEEKYRELVENANSIILKWDRSGHITFFNEYAQQFFGYTSGEILGKSVVGTIVPATESGSERDLARMIKEIIRNPEKFVHNKNENVKKNGERVWIQWRNKPLFDANGDFDGLLSIGTDVTEQRQTASALAESEEKYRLIAENSPDMILFIDPRGYIRYANARAVQALGTGPGHIEGRHIADVFGPGLAETRLARIRAQIETGVPVHREIREKFPSGKMWVEEHLSPVADTTGKIIGVLGVSRDIGDRRAAEGALRRSEGAIREANKKLHLLTSITRHDLINQLTVIRGYAHMALLKNADPIIGGSLAKIDAAMDKVQGQIEFMKTYQDLGEKAPAWFRIAELVEDARPQEVSVACTCGTNEIYADPLIGRVFYNLFDNAVRHGGKVTRIAVSCTQSGHGLLITVEDNGIGIPQEEKEKIFEKGFGKNTGFGLFLVREILGITGILIRETGTPGRGARFEILVSAGAFRSTHA